MRILFLSNFYPPVRPGGYTQWCHEVAQRLEARGHEIGVLTSNFQIDRVGEEEEQNVWRLLHLEGDLDHYQPIKFFSTRRTNERSNKANVKRAIREFAPDLVFVWGMWSMSKWVPAMAEEIMSDNLVYYLSDYWPASHDQHTAYWSLPARRWYRRPSKAVMSALALEILKREGSPELEFRHTICVSAAVRRNLTAAGIPLENAEVIHGGTDLGRFPAPQSKNGHSENLQLVYAGQIVPHKGVHTVIEAVAHLAKSGNIRPFEVTLVGDGPSSYQSQLTSVVELEQLEHIVHFGGGVAKEEMPDLLRRFDVLLFPSIYEEPLARMTQEAMAAGLVVIGTTTGGTSEILLDGQNGLTFEAEDSIGLARQIDRLARDPSLRRELAAAGRRTVVEHFTLERMVNEIEAYLTSVHDRREPIAADLH